MTLIVSLRIPDGIVIAGDSLSTIVTQNQFNPIPNVGGDIDIAFVTPFDGFRWIRQKTISKILEEK